MFASNAVAMAGAFRLLGNFILSYFGEKQLFLEVL